MTKEVEEILEMLYDRQANYDKQGSAMPLGMTREYTRIKMIEVRQIIKEIENEHRQDS
jgi:hypothetical protein